MQIVCFSNKQFLRFCQIFKEMTLERMDNFLEKQLEKFRSVVSSQGKKISNNYRFIQPLNGRKVNDIVFIE